MHHGKTAGRVIERFLQVAIGVLVAAALLLVLPGASPGKPGDTFGFLVTRPDNSILQAMKSTGAEWIRPHPGPFVWQAMQRNPGKAINFAKTDRTVMRAQDAGLNLLVTLWPYADWDQQDSPTAVSPRDEFLRYGLPLHRGSPRDGNAYAAWLTTVIERYDGDGRDDMPGLQRPIRHWEVCNEPDLTSAPGAEGPAFYIGGAPEYAKLLETTSRIIRRADPKALVVIAGAAGSSPESAKFWGEVFSHPRVGSAFDIGNVHSISPRTPSDLNVAFYRGLLEKQGIRKPIWVTEAECITRDNAEANGRELQQVVAQARASGAEKIFFTGGALSGSQWRYDPQAVVADSPAYRKIIAASR